jgi:hypothetical protein
VAAAGEPSSTRTIESTGGSVAVGCTGDRVRLEFATPRPGYSTDVNDPGPDKLDVRFEHDDDESRVVVTCRSGSAQVEVRDP